MNYPSIQYCSKRGRILWFTFCLVNVKGFNKKNKQYLKYPRIPSAIRPVAHSEEIPVPIFTKLLKIDDTSFAHLLLVLKKTLQIFFSYVMKIVTNQFCLLSRL